MYSASVFMCRWFIILPLCLALMGCGDLNSHHGIITMPPPPSAGCDYNVYRHNPRGWLIKQAKIRFIFLGSYWVSEFTRAMAIVSSWNDLVTNRRILSSTLSEYEIQDGIVADAVWILGAGIGNGIDDMPLVNDVDIPKILDQSIFRGDLPIPDNDTVIITVLPPNTFTELLINNEWGGYHAASSFGSVVYAYAVIGPLPDIDNIISHELYETVTDPSDDGYSDDTYGEIADICNSVTRELGAYTIQKAFSQKACQCR